MKTAHWDRVLNTGLATKGAGLGEAKVMGLDGSSCVHPGFLTVLAQRRYQKAGIEIVEQPPDVELQFGPPD
jgi:hypothetical protein